MIHQVHRENSKEIRKLNRQKEISNKQWYENELIDKEKQLFVFIFFFIL